MLVAAIDWALTAQIAAAIFTAAAAVAAWLSARASVAAVRLAERDREAERLRQDRARYETVRERLIVLRDAAVTDRLEALQMARLAVDVHLPLGHRHDYPQATYFLSTVRGPQEVHSPESRETVERAIEEMERNIEEINSRLLALRR